MDEVEDVTLEWKNHDNKNVKSVQVAGEFSNWKKLTLVESQHGLWTLRYKYPS